VPGMQEKLQAQLRGLGGGFLPEYLARPHVATGRLVEKKMQRAPRMVPMSYAWLRAVDGHGGRALQWWLKQLDNPATRKALLERDLSA
jgi:DNA-binding transcriptional LysR family regulator